MANDLFDFINEAPKPFASIEQIQALIRRRRAQMLIHSCIYYEMNENVISDHLWQHWADELDRIQKDWPELCQIDFFDNEFRDWSGATGNHLPHRHPWVYNKALYILRISQEKRHDTTI